MLTNRYLQAGVIEHHCIIKQHRNNNNQPTNHSPFHSLQPLSHLRHSSLVEYLYG